VKKYQSTPIGLQHSEVQVHIQLIDQRATPNVRWLLLVSQGNIVRCSLNVHSHMAPEHQSSDQSQKFLLQHGVMAASKIKIYQFLLDNLNVDYSSYYLNITYYLLKIF